MFACADTLVGAMDAITLAAVKGCGGGARGFVGCVCAVEFVGGTGYI